MSVKYAKSVPELTRKRRMCCSRSRASVAAVLQNVLFRVSGHKSAAIDLSAVDTNPWALL